MDFAIYSHPYIVLISWLDILVRTWNACRPALPAFEQWGSVASLNPKPYSPPPKASCSEA